MGIRVLPNANSVDVIKRARAELESIKRDLPTGMEASVAYDATAYINDAMHEVFKTLIETLCIVILVIFLFLGSWRSVLAPIVAIPVSLIGAVFISGIVALTLSPMICSKLLHRGDADKGFSGVINRNFDRFRNAYGRLLDRTLQVRPAVYVVWAGLALLTIPMFKMSKHELAPTEDQGVIFGFIDSPANATLDQLQPFADAAGKVFHSFPETNFSFQITSPDESFGGMVLKPWGVRTKPTNAFVGPVMMGLMQIPGIDMFPIMPPALPGGGFMPVEFYICSTAEPERILELAKELKMRR